MDDQELLDYVEQKIFCKMIEGCDILDHLGHKKFDSGCWSVSMRADEVARLLDMAKMTKENNQ